jgi:hypothetical protein
MARIDFTTSPGNFLVRPNENGGVSMEDLQEKMAFAIGSSQFEIVDVRAKVRDALNAAKKVRQDYLDALDAWGKCLQDFSPMKTR